MNDVLSDPKGVSDISWFTLRSDLLTTFADAVHRISTSSDKTMLYMALDLGKLLVWQGHKIDRKADACGIPVPGDEKKPTMQELGRAIRDAAVSRLNNHDTQISGRVFALNLDTLRAQARIAQLQGGAL